LTGVRNYDFEKAEREVGGLEVNYLTCLTESKTQDQVTHSTLCKSCSKYLMNFMCNHQTVMKLKVDRDIGSAICGLVFINSSLKCCHSATLCHEFSHLLWALPSLRYPPRSSYILGGHANISSLFS
jgi:hypothetical protein